jgi:hypothetical protein
MLQQPNQGQRPNKPVIYDFIQKTSRRIIAIGASLRTWLRAVDRIVFSPEPTHQPDAQLIADLVEILLAGERKPPKLDD